MATKRRASVCPDPAPPAAPAVSVYPSAGPAKKLPCPQATSERAGRVFSQRFFCVERKRTGETSEEFKVLGSTGNCYTVRIGKVPDCDCPDGLRGNKCKHQLFVLLKILQVPYSSNLWYQAALLSSELTAIFANARPAPRTAFEEGIVKRYKVAMGALEPDEAAASGSDAGLVKKRVPEEGDSCPICYEDFTTGSAAGLVFCLTEKGCGNALHAECFRNWAMTCKPTTCPLCREKWAAPAASTSGNAQAGPSMSREGYANFAGAAGISTKRDTSSYHQGPRRDRSGGGWRRGYDDDDFYGGFGEFGDYY